MLSSAPYGFAQSAFGITHYQITDNSLVSDISTTIGDGLDRIIYENKYI